MPTDVYGRRAASFGGAFSADDALMTFPGLRDGAGNRITAQVPLLVQNASFGYQQAVTRLYDISSSNIYYVAGPAAGEGNISQILGPAKVSRAFLQSYGTVCDAGEHVLNFQMLTGCRTTSATNDSAAWETAHGFRAAYVVLTSIGLQMAAQQMVIQQSLGMMFSSLEYSDNAA